MARRRGLSIRPGEWLSDQRLAHLRLAELGALMRLAILAVENHDRGAFRTEAGKPLTWAQLVRMIHVTDRAACRALWSLMKSGLVSKEEDGAFKVAFLERDKSGGGILVPNKVQKNSPLSPITPIPPEKKRREKGARGAAVDWDGMLTDQLRAAKGVADAWKKWVEYVSELMRPTQAKLREDMRRMTEILEQAGPEAVVSAIDWVVSLGYRTITREPSQKPRNPTKNPQSSAADEVDGFSSRHRPNVL